MAPLAPFDARPQQLIRIGPAASYLGRKVSWLRKQVAERNIAQYRVGGILMFDPADLDAYIAASRVEAQR